jgi:hypothetical protein
MEYDPTDPLSIEHYGRRLLDSSLRLTQGMRPIPDEFLEQSSGGRTRGKFGEVLERYYYGIKPGNTPYKPDFPLAMVELKSTGMSRRPHGYPWAPKYRLVLNKYDYAAESAAPSIEESSFHKKNSAIMLVGFEWEADTPLVDLGIRCAGLLRFRDIPKVDWDVIVKDFHLLQNKVRSGKADEISEGDTNYLGLCRKGTKDEKPSPGLYGSGPLLGRAYSFKPGFVHHLLGVLHPVWSERARLTPNTLSFLEAGLEEDFLARFEKFRGWAVGRICEALEYKLSAAKNSNNLLAVRMAGGKGKSLPAEFQKANILLKTVHLEESGYLKESMSFEGFDFNFLLQEDWDAPAVREEDEEENPSYPQFKRLLERKLLIVVFQGERGPTGRFIGGFFWQMDVATLNGPVKEVWERMRKAVEESSPSDFPKISENPVAHVRPKAKTADDREQLKDGTTHTKQCFWLNASFVASIIRAHLGVNIRHNPRQLRFYE